MSFNGWMLPDAERARLLKQFPPTYPVVKASHVTNKIDNDVIPMNARVVVIGHLAHDGVEALVVTVDGFSQRADNRLYHITLSLEEGRASKESNDILEQMPYREVEPFPIRTRAFLSRGDSYITTPLSA